MVPTPPLQRSGHWLILLPLRETERNEALKRRGSRNLAVTVTLTVAWSPTAKTRWIQTRSTPGVVMTRETIQSGLLKFSLDAVDGRVCERTVDSTLAPCLEEDKWHAPKMRCHGSQRWWGRRNMQIRPRDPIYMWLRWNIVGVLCLSRWNFNMTYSCRFEKTTSLASYSGAKQLCVLHLWPGNIASVLTHPIDECNSSQASFCIVINKRHDYKQVQDLLVSSMSYCKYVIHLNLRLILLIKVTVSNSTSCRSQKAVVLFSHCI